jgi:hypothetical protein
VTKVYDSFIKKECQSRREKTSIEPWANSRTTIELPHLEKLFDIDGQSRNRFGKIFKKRQNSHFLNSKKGNFSTF